MNRERDVRRLFHIGDVLSVVTGYDVSPRGGAAVRALEEYVVGRPLKDPLQRVVDCGRAWQAVREQFPELCVFDDDDIPPREMLESWLARRIAEFQEYLPVSPLESGT